MTERQNAIIKQILEVLNRMDGGQVAESHLHAEICLLVRPNASLAEFNDALSICDRAGWVIGVASKFGKKLWNISDAGQAARLEMGRA